MLLSMHCNLTKAIQSLANPKFYFKVRATFAVKSDGEVKLGRLFRNG
jgi:hypothetical protein